MDRYIVAVGVTLLVVFVLHTLHRVEQKIPIKEGVTPESDPSSEEE